MKIAIGTVQFGLDYGINNNSGIVKKKEINNILNYAYKNGIRLIDTAQSYGSSESNLGCSDVSKFKIITKLSPKIKTKNIFKSILNSLTNLNVNKLEGVLFHDFSDHYNNHNLFNELLKIKDSGIIKKIGFSLYNPHELDFLLNSKINFDIVQIPFNIYDQRFKKYFEILNNKKIEIHTRSIFLQGLVFSRPNNLSSHFDSHKPHFLKFQEFCTQMNKSIADVCLNFVYSQPEISKVIVGINSLDELKINLNYINNFDKKLDLDRMKHFIINDEKILLPYQWK